MSNCHAVSGRPSLPRLLIALAVVGASRRGDGAVKFARWNGRIPNWNTASPARNLGGTPKRRVDIRRLQSEPTHRRTKHRLRLQVRAWYSGDLLRPAICRTGEPLYGESMWSVRPRAAVWKPGQPRTQRDEAAMEFEPANGSCACKWRRQAFACLHALHPKQQNP